MGETQKPKTVAEIAHAASQFVHDGMKSGAVLPLRQAMDLLDKLESGDYEKGRDAKIEPERTEPKPEPKPKAKRAKKKAKRSRSTRR